MATRCARRSSHARWPRSQRSNPRNRALTPRPTHESAGCPRRHPDAFPCGLRPRPSARALNRTTRNRCSSCGRQLRCLPRSRQRPLLRSRLPHQLPLLENPLPPQLPSSRSRLPHPPPSPRSRLPHPPPSPRSRLPHPPPLPRSRLLRLRSHARARGRSPRRRSRQTSRTTRSRPCGSHRPRPLRANPPIVRA